ncbi:hypothetical protein [Caldisalinibacter kiritimatiensis]|uniref:Uncharacterized protein n=1 Tax=Caldisalinibacter kiritimatiensis TaxID=1304284 RepID=R1CP35_9FIRM|nr:hypothetical protein [Caldisalinibacter kiritimatiensis]EOD00456.1 hypothetical protein L21TH_1517 [Caldisalinibacter kiritimatiensis]
MSRKSRIQVEEIYINGDENKRVERLEELLILIIKKSEGIEVKP